MQEFGQAKEEAGDQFTFESLAIEACFLTVFRAIDQFTSAKCRSS
jgi:hypothetical protein